MKLYVYFAFETVKENGEGVRGGGGGRGMLLWNDINVQKWFHMQRLNRRGLGRPGIGPHPGK